jgi:hypothetical protein
MSPPPQGTQADAGVPDLEARLAALRRGRRARPVRAPLAFEWRATCPAPAFSFGVPFPWKEAPDALFDGQDALVELFVRRADGLIPTLSLWFEDDGPDVTTADSRPLVQQISASAQATYLGPWRLLLGGARSQVFVFRSASEVLLHLVVNHGNGLLQGQFRLPAVAALGYLAHVETMLGTWDWGP